MRVAIYTQHFVGVGHHLRSLRVAGAFARSHRVRVFDGGRPFHGSESLDGELRVQLPAVIKGERGLEPFARGESLDRTMRARTRLLGICRRSGAILRPFSTDFEAVLAGADLSISRAGYNTVAALLAAGVRAIVLPSMSLHDQSFRAPRMHERGLAVTCEESGLSAERLAGMIADALARPAPRHRIDLEGARTTVRIAEALVAGELAGARAISVAAPPAAIAS